MNANDPNPRKSGGMTTIRDGQPIVVGAYRRLASPIAEVRA